MKTNIIFIHALSQRCGHNFLSNLIQSQMDIKVFIHNTHEVIVPELLASKVDELENSPKFIRNKEAKIKEISIAANDYISRTEHPIFKTSTLFSKNEVDLFPNIKHLILIRHPQDLFVSYEKSIYSFRKMTFKARIKTLLRPLYSFYVLSQWSKQLQESVTILDKIETPYLLVKYESLLEIDGQKEIFKFLNIPFKNDKPIKLENINSSFSSPEEKWKKASQTVGNTTTRFDKAPKWLKFIVRRRLNALVAALDYALK